MTPTPRKPALTAAKVAWTLFGLLLAFNLVFFGFDAYPIVERKIARIGIGSLSNEEFEQKAVQQGLYLLNNPHPFVINDETRYLLFEHLSGNRKVHSDRLDRDRAAAADNDGHGDWLLAEDTSPLGILAMGVLTYAEDHPNDPRPLEALRGYVDRFLDGENGLKLKPANVEQAVQGIAMSYLAKVTGEDKYKRGCDEIANFYLKSFRETGEPIPYVVWDTDRFVLVDTLGMMCPFLVRYAALTGNTEALDLALFQLDDYFKHGVNPANNIPFHGYNPTRGDCPIGVSTWGRGSGWLAIAMQDVLQWTPVNHPTRPQLVERYQKFAEAWRLKQRSDGTWGEMLSLAVAKVDSSATAMICQFLMYGRLNGILGPEFDEPINLAYEALRKNTRTDGTLDFCQGPPPEMNRHSRRWGPNRYGQGALLTCITFQRRLEAMRAQTKASSDTPLLHP